MTHEEKKIGKIVEELTMYFFSIGADHISSTIDKDGRDVTITMECNYQPEYREDMSRLSEYLNEPKDDSVEDIYWELAGSGDPGEGSQLLLLGMMLDKAEVTIEEDKLYLKLYKELL
ncbi:MAG: hypothetical protein IJX63_00115 [Lachnospiraceae bacterium]|nr:hypothetical protein [Lachnospiraceae bacterium]